MGPAGNTIQVVLQILPDNTNGGSGPTIDGDVFGVIGDSNADGRGGSIPSVSPDTLYKWTGITWDEITTQAISNDGISGSIWQQFATDYKANTGRSVLVVNGGSGGSEFYPNADNNNWYITGTLYSAWKTNMVNALGGHTPKGIFINLGINDIRAATSLANINTGLSSLITRLTVDFPGVPLIFIQLGRSESVANNSLIYGVRKAIRDAAVANANVHICGAAASFITVSGGYNVDNLHYSQATNNALGSMLSRWYGNSAYTKWTRSIVSSLHDEIGTTRKGHIETWMTGMGDDYFLLNGFTSFRTTTANNTLLDWTFIGYQASAGNTFTANTSIGTDGTIAQSIAVSFIPNIYAVGGLGQNDFRYGVRIATVGTIAGTAAIMSGQDGTTGTAIRIAQGNLTSTTNFRSNTSTSTNGTEQDLMPNTLYAVARNGTTEQFYRNKTLDVSGTKASSGATDAALRIGAGVVAGVLAFPFSGTYLYYFCSPYTGFDYDNFFDTTEALMTAW